MTRVRRAVYPGSFDPIHDGHVDIINRIAKIFDEVTVLVAVSPDKGALFSIEERETLLKKSLSHLKNVKVDSFSGLTMEYMKKKKAHILVRGLRAVMDFEYETSMANMNRHLDPKVETFLVFSAPEYSFLSSRGIKEVVRNQGSVKNLVPSAVETALRQKVKDGSLVRSSK